MKGQAQIRRRPVTSSGSWRGSDSGMAVSRADTTYVAGCLFRALELCAHAVHAHAGRWLVNEKGVVASAPSP